MIEIEKNNIISGCTSLICSNKYLSNEDELINNELNWFSGRYIWLNDQLYIIQIGFSCCNLCLIDDYLNNNYTVLMQYPYNQNAGDNIAQTLTFIQNYLGRFKDGMLVPTPGKIYTLQYDFQKPKILDNETTPFLLINDTFAPANYIIYSDHEPSEYSMYGYPFTTGKTIFNSVVNKFYVI